MKNEMEIYSNGIVHCSICVPKEKTIKEIESFVNWTNSTGIDSHWRVSKDSFADGSENPKVCNTSEDKLHYLMVC